jgi:4-hydroxybutyrate dehydrogenase/sulfolactaldehyde 3-reductase
MHCDRVLLIAVQLPGGRINHRCNLLQVGFTGLGIMGLPMAKNPLKAGNAMCVYDIGPAAAKEMQELGAVVASSPREVAEKSEFVMTMLPDAPDVGFRLSSG